MTRATTEEIQTTWYCYYNGLYVGYTTAGSNYHAIEKCYSKNMQIYPDRTKLKAFKTRR